MAHALPNPDALSETYKVDQGGKRYEVEFRRGKPVQVRVRMQKTAYGYSYRTIFWGGYNAEHIADLTGRCAEVVAYVTDPAKAAANYARVRDPAKLKADAEAYHADFRRRHAARQTAEAKAKRVADAAPALLAALEVFLLCPETRALLDEHDPMAVKQAIEAVTAAGGQTEAVR